MLYKGKEKVGVLIATYNGEKYICEQIDSILSQCPFNTTIFVHDDGSTDLTKEILYKYENDNLGRFVILEGRSTGSPKANFMFIIEQALHYDIDYFFLADQDDVWLSNKFEIMINEMHKVEQENKPCVIFSDMKVVDEKLNIIDSSFFKYIDADPQRIAPNQLIMQSFIAGCSMLINRKSAELSTQYTNIENIFMHDWWIALIGAYIGNLVCVDDSLVLYRQHGSNQMGAHAFTKLELVKHFFKIIFGNHKKEITSRVIRSRKFASELKLVPGITDEQYRFLEEFSELDKCSKFERIKFYKVNNLTRKRRNLIFLLFV